MSDVTDKERLMLPLIAAGLSNAEIGKELGCSGAAVGKRISKLMCRWQALSRAHLVHLAYLRGVLQVRKPRKVPEPKPAPMQPTLPPPLVRVPWDPPDVIRYRQRVLLGKQPTGAVVEPVPLDEFTGEG